MEFILKWLEKKYNQLFTIKTTVKDNSRRVITHQHEIYSSGANVQALQSCFASHQPALSIYHQLGLRFKQIMGLN